MELEIIDVILVLLLALALVTGLVRGLLASLGSLLGLAAGAVAAFWVVPLVNGWVPDPFWRGLAVVGAIVLLLVVGTALGALLGRALRKGVDRTPLKPLDRLFGALGALVAGLVAISFVGSTLVLMGTPVLASALASSQVVRTIDRFTPAPLASALAELRSFVLDEGLPTLGGLVLPSEAVLDAADPIAVDDPALDRAARSVARVTGMAYSCGTGSSGSGFVAAPGLIVTNAHVVAGVDAPVVQLPDEQPREGRVVLFDPVTDLAVLAVDGLGADALPLAPVQDPGAGLAVQGYPHGGPFRSGPAQVLAVGTPLLADVYGEEEAPREIYTLSAEIRPGNSGGPVLTADGAVAGVVFARDEVREDIGYALTVSELLPALALADAGGETVSTGGCTR